MRGAGGGGWVGSGGKVMGWMAWVGWWGGGVIG